MEEIVAWLRFDAREVYEMLRRVHERELEELWLIRGQSCYLQTPDFRDRADPVHHKGLDLLTISPGALKSPRVEVLELHNHVLRTLANMNELKDVCVEFRYNEYDEYCLVLCRCTKQKKQIRLSWLSCINDGRLF